MSGGAKDSNFPPVDERLVAPGWLTTSNYVDERGERCRETRYLELHHLQPFARRGQHVATNLALRCAAHNALVAEQDFGPAVIEPKRHAARHDSFSAVHQRGSYIER